MESHPASYSQAADFDVQCAVRARDEKVALLNRFDQMECLINRLNEVGECSIHPYTYTN
jgi:BMFP domain-containing protein YqiC